MSGSSSLTAPGLVGIPASLLLKTGCLHTGDKALEPHKEASSDPDLELLLRHPEHGEEVEEVVETPQQH